MQTNNAHLNSIGERIRAFALDKYGKINDFADALGMGAPNVQAYMRGARKPGSSVLQKIQSLGCNLDWLLTGEGEMFTQKDGAGSGDLEDGTQSHSMAVQRTENDALIDRFSSMDKNKPYFMLAIGWRLAVHDEDIRERDLLIIDPTVKVIEGDVIVRSTPEGAEVARYQPGEENLLGAIVKTIRNYPAFDRQ